MAHLPREVIHWLDRLDLAYSVRNCRRDLANGFIVAEILSRYFPKEINIYSYDNGLKNSKKLDNWQRISKILKAKDLEIPKEEFEPVVYYAKGAAELVLKKLYEFLEKRKWPERPIQFQEEQPNWMRPTASLITKNTELARIVDNDKKKNRIIYSLAMHQEKKKQELKSQDLQQYMTTKRQKFLATKQREQEEAFRKSRRTVQPEPPMEIKEIKLNSLHTSTGKKNNKDNQQTIILEAKGVVEYIEEVGKDMLDNIEENEIEEAKREKDTPQIQFVLDNTREVSDDSLNILFSTLKDRSAGIVERLQNNFTEIKKFFSIFNKPLSELHWKSGAFMNLVEFLKHIGSALMKEDPSTTEAMFETLVIPDLVDIINSTPNKREDVCQILFSFCSMDSITRHRYLKKIKDKLNHNLKTFISILSVAVSFDYEGEFTDELYNLYFYYGMLALDFPSPMTRAHGLKILSEIVYVNFYPIIQILHKFENLVKDKWWEVQSLILILCSSLLTHIAREKENPQNNQPFTPRNEDESGDLGKESSNDQIGHEAGGVIQERQIEEDKAEDMQEFARVNEQIKVKNNYDTEEKFLLDIINDIFDFSSHQSVLKIGLIYLASSTIRYPQLCKRYIDILLNVGDDTRTTVLDINPVPGTEEGYITQNSFKYKLTGSPLLWNAVGIAEALEKIVKKDKLDNFERVHIEILAGCLVQPLEEKDWEVWLRIYESLKRYIFAGLCERELCQLSSEVLKKLFTFDKILNMVLKNSRYTFYKTLDVMYRDDSDQLCQENLLEFFEFLQNAEVKDFKQYNYEIIKEFSEKNKKQFLRSNLVNFMNTITQERRDMIFGSGILL